MLHLTNHSYTHIRTHVHTHTCTCMCLHPNTPSSSHQSAGFELTLALPSPSHSHHQSIPFPCAVDLTLPSSTVRSPSPSQIHPSICSSSPPQLAEFTLVAQPESTMSPIPPLLLTRLNPPSSPYWVHALINSFLASSPNQILPSSYRNLADAPAIHFSPLYRIHFRCPAGLNSSSRPTSAHRPAEFTSSPCQIRQATQPFPPHLPTALSHFPSRPSPVLQSPFPNARVKLPTAPCPRLPSPCRICPSPVKLHPVALLEFTSSPQPLSSPCPAKFHPVALLSFTSIYHRLHPVAQ